jgi:sulfatase modifying factor 1
LESQDEWTKAAYYNPSGGYSLFPDQSRTITQAQANYDTSDTTPVASFSDTSYYGTYDQGGDVYQFNDSIENTSYRGDLGGSFSDTGNTPLKDTVTSYVSETYKNDNVGFRVVQLVPEPASAAVVVAGMTGLLARRRRGRDRI